MGKKYFWLTLTRLWIGLIFFLSTDGFAAVKTLGWVARSAGQLVLGQ